MLIFAIDDEPVLLKALHKAIVKAEPDATVMDFSLGTEALQAVETGGCRPDIVFSDIRMPQLDGLALAVRLKKLAAAKARLRLLISDLKGTLAQIGMEDILVRHSGRLSLLRDRIPCDYYYMLSGDMKWVNRFYGEYMSQYSWAEGTRGKLSFWDR